MRLVASFILFLSIFIFLSFTNSFNLFNPPSAYAQTYMISGRIACPGCANEPYGGYPNIPYNISGPSSGFGATGFNGSFSVGNLKAGTYLVSIAPGACLSGVTQQSVTLGPSKSVSFSVIPKSDTLTGSVTNSKTGTGIGNVTITENSGAGTTTSITDGSGNYSYTHGCSNFANATATITVPANYVALSATTVGFSDNANDTASFTLQPFSVFTGTVFNDANESGSLNTGDSGYQGITVTITNSTGTQTTTTDANGNYTLLANPTVGNSTVTISGIPAGWFNTTPTSQTIASSADKSGLNFGIAQENTISGNAFVDLNKNGIKDSGESNYSATPQITLNPNSGTITANSDGSYTISNLLPGTYSVIYGTPPAGYYMTSPLTGPPNLFNVTVGSGCTVNSAPGATCANGNISNLSFGISNTFPWFQSNCGDMRNDNGITDNLPSGIPAIVTTSPCTSPSILFTGNANANLGKGTASPVVGGVTYPEMYPSSYSPLSTSYPSLYSKSTNAGINPQDITTTSSSCTLSSCTLPANLTHGIYIASNSLNLNTWTAPAGDYIFLVNGDLKINGPITVPVGSTVLFSVNGNITVASSVGTATLTSATPSLAGWYVAGGSFILPSAGNCTDLRLNIAGSVIVDSLGTGGTFQNNRDLCGGDTSNPTVSFIQRLDMILNAPQFLQQQVTLSREVSP